MDLDWYSEEDLKDTIIFNDSSIITYKNNNSLNDDTSENLLENKEDLKVENCFEQNLDVKNGQELLNILHYLSVVSNYLRSLIRNKNKVSDNISNGILNENEYNQILKFLTWIKEALIKIKVFFAIPYRKDNSFDPLNIKPFKTSSYKFCNFKETCSIHKNKNKNCDKNHFVFDMIINDITKLIESINMLEIHNLNWILSNKNISITYSPETTQYLITKLISNQQIQNDDNVFLIDKTLIFKSFDVSSYVINKMYEEAYSFLNYNISSYQINI